ncbi:hypothetical protein F4813DRAFT_361099 [Daldinia decipiens]|uniref:uncharacterized protein n=1 Tax=Daldinia decipiens TaxID=326647 RepID=UPI0020C45FE8|nr:uncharacterized protein F4813DRAFT_361099 [Daldinia decipiens]KAI1657335.1 hypothetical protein F4813DRAFT_361099 [Daldinia decipiens]
MPVSIEQALAWEMTDSLPNEYAKIFAEERTKDWATRLEEYWARQANKSTEKGQIQHVHGDTLEHFRLARRDTQPEFHGFMHLSPEIRAMVYEYHLLKGTIFMPNTTPMRYGVNYDTKLTRDSRGRVYPRYKGLPNNWGLRYGRSIGLICGVSHAIQAETMPIFYGRNRFVFPPGNIDFPMLCNHESLPSSIWVPNHMRDISHTFDMRDDTWTNFQRSHKLRFQLGGEEDGEDGGEEGVAAEFDSETYMRRFHDSAMNELLSSWDDRVTDVQNMNLNRLQISLEECYCSLGCCRLVNTVLDRLVNAISAKPRNIRPKVIEVYGWNNEAEKSVIREALETLSTDEAPVEVRFLGDIKEGRIMKGVVYLTTLEFLRPQN